MATFFKGAWEIMCTLSGVKTVSGVRSLSDWYRNAKWFFVILQMEKSRGNKLLPFWTLDQCQEVCWDIEKCVHIYSFHISLQLPIHNPTEIWQCILLQKFKMFLSFDFKKTDLGMRDWHIAHPMSCEEVEAHEISKWLSEFSPDSLAWGSLCNLL